MSNPSSKFHGLFFPEALPPGYAASEYRAFRAALPELIIIGTAQSIRLAPEGKLAITGAPNAQIEYIPKKDSTDRSESHTYRKCAQRMVLSEVG
ncbi:MAG: hypothetical protein QOF71_3226 [Candidatus Eremiobacteraeota bacterium]|nr:hypothetical protein [Candidatus Eremiobacteraeota bacterium]